MSLLDHLPVLVVIVPLLAGPVCVLAERPRAAWGVALAAAWLSFAAAVALAVQVSATGTISYELGGWAPPWGIEFRIDALNAFLLEQKSRDRSVLLLIDEAQNLDAAALEQIRLLTNLETPTHKLLQIVLIGQPELRAKLAYWREWLPDIDEVL